jgi:REP element-mobilizing transposase RayT
MTRAPRIHVPGSYYHVTNRGADRQDLFSCDDDHRYFESLLGDTHQRHSIEFHAYCAMTTHFHSLVRVPNEGFSAAFQHVTGRYATYYNHRYQRTGPVFDGRFRSVLIESDEQLITAARYIHRNPLSFVPLPALASYRWSSYPASLGRADPPNWLVTDESLVLAAMDPLEYRSFVETPLPSDTTPARGVDARRNTAREVITAVAAAAGVDPDQLLISRRGSQNAPRLLAISLLVEQRQLGVDEIARHFGLASPSAVRNAARRARVLEAADPGFAALRWRATGRRDVRA